MFVFVFAVLFSIFTGHGHIATYSNPGQRGVVVQLDATHCAGYEFAGDAGPGAWGNVFGLTGGDCA